MKKITIGRYSPPPEGALDRLAPEDRDRYVDISNSGWIEGERDDGTTWILFTDNNGSPIVFWPDREDGGAVIGDGILLQPATE